VIAIKFVREERGERREGEIKEWDRCGNDGEQVEKS
jgi:hypothetical protein